jgi:hypothetical protein
VWCSGTSRKPVGGRGAGGCDLERRPPACIAFREFLSFVGRNEMLSALSQDSGQEVRTTTSSVSAALAKLARHLQPEALLPHRHRRLSSRWCVLWIPPGRKAFPCGEQEDETKTGTTYSGINIILYNSRTSFQSPFPSIGSLCSSSSHVVRNFTMQ